MSILFGVIGIALIILGVVLIIKGRNQDNVKKIVAGAISAVLGLILTFVACSGVVVSCDASGSRTGSGASVSTGTAAFTGYVLAKPKPKKKSRDCD